MTENSLPYGEVSGNCRGATGEVYPPTDVRVVAGREDTTVFCDLIAADGSCEASPLIDAKCIWLSPTARTEERPRDTFLHCPTNVGELVYDAASRIVVATPYIPEINGDLTLTHAEGSMLEDLMRNQGQPRTRQQLENTFNPSMYFSGGNTVNVHINRLRKRLGQEETSDHTRDAQVIQSVRRVGYRIPPPPRG